jgi:hypothetical protein
LRSFLASSCFPWLHINFAAWLNQIAIEVSDPRIQHKCIQKRWNKNQKSSTKVQYSAEKWPGL